MWYESWSPELQGSAQSRPIHWGPKYAGTMVRPMYAFLCDMLYESHIGAESGRCIIFAKIGLITNRI